MANKTKHGNKVFRAMQKPCIITIQVGKKKITSLRFQTVSEALYNIRQNAPVEKQFVNAMVERLHKK